MSSFVRMRRWVAVLLLVTLGAGLLPAPCPAAETAAKPAGTTTSRLLSHVRYSGTGWGYLTPLFFGATRAFEALTMKNATAAERVDHATRWAKDGKFWAAVGADILACTVAERLVMCLPGGAFVKSALVCFAGFAAFEGVYGGFDQVDWKTLIFQSLVLTAVEMAVLSLGLPFGGLLAFAASFVVCMLLDKFDGFDGEEFDEKYMGEGSTGGAPEVGTRVDGRPAASSPTYEPGVADATARGDAYQRFLDAMDRGDQAAAREAYDEYKGYTDATGAARGGAVGW